MANIEETSEAGPVRFYVLAENEPAAIAHVNARGFSPMTIERGDGDTVILIFESRPDDELFELVQALPGHLSAKVGIIAGDRPPFASEPER